MCRTPGDNEIDYYTKVECGKVSHDSHIVTKHDIGHILVIHWSYHSHNM